MARETREASKARTRQRVLDEAERLFRERGYAATSLEQIAEAADVTKGAIYGHFSSKEDLLLSAIEATPTPDYGAVLNDADQPLRDRLSAFGATMAAEASAADRAELAVLLEFVAALLRNPEALARFSADHERRLRELAAADPDEPIEGTTRVEVWAVGDALSFGLRVYQYLAPALLTPAAYASAYQLLAGYYADS